MNIEITTDYISRLDDDHFWYISEAESTFSIGVIVSHAAPGFSEYLTTEDLVSKLIELNKTKKQIGNSK